MRIGAKTGQVVPEKVPEKVLGGFGAEAGQVQHGFEAGSLGAKPSRVQWVPEKVPALGIAARFRKIFKNKTLRLSGKPPKLISFCPTQQHNGVFSSE